jgi:hypothetical protein
MIKLCFSGQENQGENRPSTYIPMIKKGRSKTEIDAPFPPIDEKLMRPPFRVSPFEPMVHLRKMPRDGTITPLKLREYEVERQMAKYKTLNLAGPPIEEVLVPDVSTAGCDQTLSSHASTSVNTPTDYKTLYLQTQRELKALQKLQERTLGENHLLRSRVKTLTKRRTMQQEDINYRPTPMNRRIYNHTPSLSHSTPHVSARPLHVSGLSSSLLSPLSTQVVGSVKGQLH